MLIINLTKLAQNVDIVDDAGTKDGVRLMPQRRGHLPPGFKVAPNWMARNPGVIRVVEEQKPIPQTPATTQITESNPKTATSVTVQQGEA